MSKFRTRTISPAKSPTCENCDSPAKCHKCGVSLCRRTENGNCEVTLLDHGPAAENICPTCHEEIEEQKRQAV